jgi:Big-like domain-containing protein
MRFDSRRLSAVLLAALSADACRPSTPRSAAMDSAGQPARVDTSTPAGAPSITRADSVVLRTDKTQYRAGEALTLTFENKGAAQYAFNPCSRSLERADGNAWKPVDEPGRMCTMEAWILEAHATRSGPTELPSSLVPGRYRVVVRMTMDRGGSQASAVNAVSDPITVS